ncbi:MAG: OmpA family protein [Pseudomonadota bacterium]
MNNPQNAERHGFHNRSVSPARLVTLLLLLIGSVCSASEAVQELREPLFEDATAALTAANRARASLLAPTAYSKGAEAYRRAEKILSDSGSIEALERALEAAEAAFAAAGTQAATAADLFAETVQARDDAVSAEAPTAAAELFRKADVALFDAAVALEKRRQSSAERDAQEARDGFRQAELDAIKANYLNETRKLLETAEDLRAKRYAPESLAAAETALADAERLLTEDRYDTDQARSLAQTAKHEVQHAIYVSEIADLLRRRKTTLEAVLAPWEDSIRRVADQLDLAVYFDNGGEQPLASIQAAIADMQSRQKFLDNQANEREEQLQTLRDQLAEVNRELGDQSAAAARLNTVLAEQQAARQRFAEVENRFKVDEATVLRKGSTVIVRLIGLTFDSGAAALKPEHHRLLDQLQGALEIFPGANVVIEGHTDSFGSDAGNLTLSQERADAVKAYLVESGNVRADRLTALGYGESQPLANNESAEGRRRNRRIDAVIYP